MYPLIQKLQKMIFKNLNKYQKNGFFRGATPVECKELKKDGIKYTSHNDKKRI